MISSKRRRGSRGVLPTRRLGYPGVVLIRLKDVIGTRAGERESLVVRPEHRLRASTKSAQQSSSLATSAAHSATRFDAGRRVRAAIPCAGRITPIPGLRSSCTTLPAASHPRPNPRILPRQEKQIRGAIVDLLLHPAPKKLLVVVLAHQTKKLNVEQHCTYVWSRLAPGRERDLRKVLLIGAPATPSEGDSVEIRRALTDLGVAVSSRTATPAAFV